MQIFKLWLFSQLLLVLLILRMIRADKRFEMNLYSKPRNVQNHHFHMGQETGLQKGFSSQQLTGVGEINNKRYLKAITKDITNFKDLQYYGDLFLGPSRQRMTFIYDTGSSWIWVPTHLCKK